MSDARSLTSLSAVNEPVRGFPTCDTTRLGARDRAAAGFAEVAQVWHDALQSQEDRVCKFEPVLLRTFRLNRGHEPKRLGGMNLLTGQQKVKQQLLRGCAYKFDIIRLTDRDR